MKYRICAALLLAVRMINLSRCGLWRIEARLDALEDVVENRVDAAEDAAERAAAMATIPESIPQKPKSRGTEPAESKNAAPLLPASEMPAELLTKEEAQTSALEYAGFTADQVSYLRTEYEIYDRMPQYDVEFHEGYWESNYWIHTQMGKILSFEKND